jgi:PAS domain S-box-containing protein
MLPSERINLSTLKVDNSQILIALIHSNETQYGAITFEHGSDDEQFTEEDALFIGQASTLLALTLSNQEKNGYQEKLEKSQEVLNQAQRIAKFASYEVDLLKGEVNWSKGADKILFFDVELDRYRKYGGMSVGDPWMEHIHKDDRLDVSDSLTKAYKHKQPFRIQYRACLPGGQNKVMLTEGMPIRNGDGKITSYLGFLQDVSEFNEVQIALINREKRLQSLFEISPLGIIEWGLDFTIKDWNPAAERIFGWKKEQVVGKSGEFLLSKDVLVDVKNIWSDLISGSDWIHSINENNTAYQDVIMCEWRNATVTGADNGVIAIVSYVEDITKKYREEEKVREMEEKYSTIFSASSDAITVTRKADGVFTEVNEGFERITGFTRQEALGNTSLGLKLVNYGEREDYMKELLEKGEVSNKEIKFLSKEGNDLIGIYSAKTVTFNNEDFIIAYCHDVTEQKKICRANRLA